MSTNILGPCVPLLLERLDTLGLNQFATSFLDTETSSMTLEGSVSQRLMDAAGESACSSSAASFSKLQWTTDGTFETTLESLPMRRLVETALIVLPLFEVQSFTVKLVRTDGECQVPTLLAALPVFSKLTCIMELALSMCQAVVNQNVWVPGAEAKSTGKPVHVLVEAGERIVQSFFAEQGQAVCAEFEALGLQCASLKTHNVRHLVDVMQQWLKQWRVEVLGLCSSFTKDAAQKLAAKIPRWEHTITDKKYNGVLARRALLSMNVTKTLVPLMSELDAFIVHSKALTKQFVGQVDATISEDIIAAEPILEHAARTVTHAAAVNLVEELAKEEDVKEQASLLLSKSCGDIKGPLLDRLTKLARG